MRSAQAVRTCITLGSTTRGREAVRLRAVANRWRLVWPMMGLLVLAVVVVAVLRYVFVAGDQRAASNLVSSVVAVLVPAGSLAVWLWARRRSTQEMACCSLDHAADMLAEQVRVQWTAAAGERRLMQPAPIPVRWRWSDLPVTGPLVDAVGDGAGWRRFAPLPGLPPVTATTLSRGGLRDLLGVCGGLDSGRVVILPASPRPRATRRSSQPPRDPTKLTMPLEPTKSCGMRASM
jgi:hypothetical protein